MGNNIKAIEFIKVDVPASGWSENTTVVKVTDENGLYGIGEADGTPSVIKAYGELETEHFQLTNICEVAIGRDPMEFKAIWDEMYDKSKWIGSRGVGIFAMSGIDMALYDLAGKQHNLPVYKLLGGKHRDVVAPYFTLYPSHNIEHPTVEDYLRLYEPLTAKARERKCKAVKVCLSPGVISLHDDKEVVRYVKALRKQLGDDVKLLVDFLYRWNDWQAARWTLNKLEDADLYLAEAVLQHDDLEGHKKLANAVSTRIGACEMMTTHYEIMEWVKNTNISAIQLDYNRAGGLTAIMRIQELCDNYNVQLMPHGWATGITAAAIRHFGMASRTAMYPEYLHRDFWPGELINNLTIDDPEIIDGTVAGSEEPGLGMKINKEYFKEKTGVILE
ncbi:MAG: mandelate racemase/muconate lactonizing enzyme family protein [Marinisporobacter sp.]|nr:mandelate racemase/muconate lactonizing enzyme family protein [Marinisporobacter sp.]